MNNNNTTTTTLFRASSYADAAASSSMSTHRPWGRPVSGIFQSSEELSESTAPVPVINICPRRHADVGDEGFFSLAQTAAPSTFWQWTAQHHQRPVRSDGDGGIAEFFAAGSPTFRRAADPFLIGCATVGGLVVLGTVLSV